MKSVFEEKIEAIKNAFEADIAKGDLETALLPPVADFLNKHFQMIADADKVYGEELKNIGWRGKSAYRKDQLLHICAAPFINQAIYRQFLETLHPDYRALWETLLFAYELTDEEILKATGVTLYTEKQFGYRNEMIKATKPRYAIFDPVKRSYSFFYRKSISYRFPPSLRGQIIGYYDVPEEAQLTGIPQPPQTRYLYDKAETLFHQEAVRFIAYYRQGEISETTKSRPALNTMARVSKTLNTSEFFEDTPYKLLRHSRAIMLAHWVIRESMIHKTDDLAVLLRARFSEKKSNLQIAPSILLHLKGFGLIGNESLLNDVEKKTLDLLAKLPHGQWVEFGRVRRYVGHLKIDFAPVSIHEVDKLSIDENLTFGPDLIEQKNGEYYLGSISPYYRHILSKPMLDGMFFFFAALGLCDIAYDAVNFKDPDNKHASFWGGLVAVRRTNLGDYVCGLTDEYRLPAFENTPILFSPDTLMIQSQGDDKALSVLLTPTPKKSAPIAIAPIAGFF